VEFLRSRNKEYVKAARALGVSNVTIMMRHILPNALTMVVTRLPFSVTAGMTALVGLDFLGLGVPPPTPSFGELLGQSLASLDAWWISVPTFTVLVGMILLITFVGEAILDVFDPKRARG
jgi:microcin C transport system permease protein